MFSPSNSGVLSIPGDVVTLTRDPAHDCVGVQIHGDGDGVELIFEGSVGSGLVAVPTDAGPESLSPTPDGRYAYLMHCGGMERVQVRLAAIRSGCVEVAIYSGPGDLMKLAAGPAPTPAEVKPVKIGRTVPPANAGPGPFRAFQTNNKWYVLVESTQRSSEPFPSKAAALAWISQQPTNKTPARNPDAPSGIAGPFKVSENGGVFVATNAAGQTSEHFGTRAEVDAWIASQRSH